MAEDAQESTGLKRVTVYTDGAAVPNPGAGGYGVVLRFGAHQKELSGGFQRTTNNRMELMAVIVGLEALKERCKVTLHSDSQYIVNAITSGSAFRWRANGWKFTPGGTKLVKNPNLWERLLTAYEKHDIEMIWVKGHAGLADNERCDALAMAACRLADLPPDPGFVENVAQEPAQEKVSQAVALKGKGEITVVKRVPRQRKLKEGQTYYFAWHLYCPGCKAMYMVEEAKQHVGDDEKRPEGTDENR